MPQIAPVSKPVITRRECVSIVEKYEQEERKHAEYLKQRAFNMWN
jgi:hypothetical protein